MALKPVRVLISGFGNVGRELVRLITEYREVLARQGVRISVVGIVDSRGALVSRQGIPEETLLQLLEVPRGGVSTFKDGRPGLTTLGALDELEGVLDVLVEVTPSNYRDAEPALSHVKRALDVGVHVVSANKGPFALKYQELASAAERRGLYLGLKATVMAGTPLIELLRYGYTGRSVELVYGVLNSTTNYILNLMHGGLSFPEALAKAQEDGYAEPDPSLDLEGWDPAAKISILSGVLGRHIPVHQVARVPLSPAVQELVEAEWPVRYIARLDVERGAASVRPEPVKPGSPLARLQGARNGVHIVSDGGKTIYLEGTGGGPRPTALALLSDVALIARAL